MSPQKKFFYLPSRYERQKDILDALFRNCDERWLEACLWNKLNPEAPKEGYPRFVFDEKAETYQLSEAEGGGTWWHWDLKAMAEGRQQIPRHSLILGHLKSH